MNILLLSIALNLVLLLIVARVWASKSNLSDQLLQAKIDSKMWKVRWADELFGTWQAIARVWVDTKKIIENIPRNIDVSKTLGPRNGNIQRSLQEAYEELSKQMPSSPDSATAEDLRQRIFGGSLSELSLPPMKRLGCRLVELSAWLELTWQGEMRNFDLAESLSASDGDSFGVTKERLLNGTSSSVHVMRLLRDSVEELRELYETSRCHYEQLVQQNEDLNAQ